MGTIRYCKHLLDHKRHPVEMFSCIDKQIRTIACLYCTSWSVSDKTGYILKSYES